MDTETVECSWCKEMVDEDDLRVTQEGSVCAHCAYYFGEECLQCGQICHIETLARVYHLDDMDYDCLCAKCERKNWDAEFQAEYQRRMKNV